MYLHALWHSTIIPARFKHDSHCGGININQTFPPHIRKQGKTLLKETFPHVPIYHCTPRNHVPFRHPVKQLPGSCNPPIPAQPINHGTPRNHIPLNHVLKNLQRFIHFTCLQISIYQRI
ncbi:hypothetical protein VIGAN_07215700 [Vigna angularis var. angularis]|uniref:Uncharacterized protein n=1 Tax=Vigna angularis var. angularis TaxID=157739 RepID=A0A0S3SK80_PHAAN|nr:hypothetical protein VIGAN_07215700 [Vigna angularis var. angularis]